MAPSSMLTGLVQFTVLIALYQLVNHNFGGDASFYGLWDNEVIKNYTDTLGAYMNQTLANNTILPAHGNKDPFAFGAGPRTVAYAVPPSPWVMMVATVAVGALLFPPLHYWHLWLERTFPARPGGVVQVAHGTTEKLKADDDLDEVREEVVVRKWIAQGKVRRSSLSLWNTLVKWVLHLTIGSMWCGCLCQELTVFMRLQPMSNLLGILHPVSVLASWY